MLRVGAHVDDVIASDLAAGEWKGVGGLGTARRDARPAEDIDVEAFALFESIHLLKSQYYVT